jgi:2-polyprenyl-3-methyl-5-hydroxy-6-metoxy-1,4-benzoquinol methylase
MRDTSAYWFGENWKRFLDENFSNERVNEAERSLAALFRKDAFVGKGFLDIGCGSGLFSLAAWRLGASRVTSIDIDPESVKCCRSLAREAIATDCREWNIVQGSILDASVVNGMAQADVVYSWGVLHHTGDMWKAIENAAKLVAPGGTLMIGIYNWKGGRFGTETWRKLKRWYCSAPRWKRRIWEWSYIAWKLTYMGLVLRNPVRQIRDYKRNRGMSWFRDVSDWLGGYPYEAATAGEVLEFVRERLYLELIKQSVDCNLGVSEFIFKKR